jgi:hypothetical protein
LECFSTCHDLYLLFVFPDPSAAEINNTSSGSISAPGPVTGRIPIRLPFLDALQKRMKSEALGRIGRIPYFGF